MGSEKGKSVLGEVENIASGLTHEGGASLETILETASLNAHGVSGDERNGLELNKSLQRWKRLCQEKQTLIDQVMLSPSGLLEMKGKRMASNVNYASSIFLSPKIPPKKKKRKRHTTLITN